MINIDHLAIWVDDIECMRQFYMMYFGATSSEKYVNPTKKYTSYFLSFEEGKARIELMHVEDKLHNSINREFLKGLTHFAMTVGTKDSVNALTERFRKDGYTIASEPRTTGDGCYESVIVDPEGNHVEICA